MRVVRFEHIRDEYGKCVIYYYQVISDHTAPKKDKSVRLIPDSLASVMKSVCDGTEIGTFPEGNKLSEENTDE